MRTTRPVTVRRSGEADELVRACRRQLADPRLPPDQRAAVEVNLASGLAQRSALAESPEGLDEAAGILLRLVGTPGLDPWLLAYAAHELVTAKDVQASRHGNADGFEEALRLEWDVVGRLPAGAPETGELRAGAYRGRSQLHLYRMTLLPADSPGFERERGAAVRALRQAIPLAGAGSGMGVDMGLMLGMLLARGGAGSPDELAAGVEQVRAVARLAGPGSRDFAAVALAQLLLAEVRAGAADPGQLDEAERLCRPVASGRSDLAGTAHLLLAEIEVERG